MPIFRMVGSGELSIEGTVVHPKFACVFQKRHQKPMIPSVCCLFSVERSGSGVELRTLDYENPGSNPGCGVKTLGKFFHSILLQFTQLNK